MSNSKYNDPTAVIQVIGSVYNNPSLLDAKDKYMVTEDDFNDDFHKIVFGSIYKIYELGANKITLENIADFLSSRPKYEAVYQQMKGEEWLLKASENAIPEAFDYYYGRLKKFSLLRAYDKCGVDVSFIYDPDNIMDTKKRQLQEDKLDNATLEELALLVDNVIEDIKIKYVDQSYGQARQAGEGVIDLIDRMKQYPEVGIPLYGSLINTVTRGAPLKKFFLRSAATGVGKSRTLVADACNFACDEIYDENFGWLKNGSKQPTLFITTEQELEEVQTMMLAFLSNVNEEHIINGKYDGDEEDRVRKAAQILAQSPLYVEEMPDFSLQDIENTIRKNIREHGVLYICLDYIHTSMKILEEITKRSGGVKLREDNILFMMSIKLKDICNECGVFIISATQLNADYVESETPDQNLLRGAKAIADKIDMGCVLLQTTQKDKDSLATIISTKGFEEPTLKLSIYKNRRGRWKGIYLWCKADLGTCRVQPMFATTYRYEFIEMNDTAVVIDEASAF